MTTFTESQSSREKAPQRALNAYPASAHDAIKAVPVRHWGRKIGAILVVLILAWGAYSLAHSKTINYAKIGEFQFNSLILEGLLKTLWISLASMALGIVLGMIAGVMRLSPNPVLSGTSWLYVWLFRGTPVLVQLAFWYFAVPLVFQNFTIAIPFTDITLFTMPMKDLMQPWGAALLGLGLNEGAYMAEIVRGGVISVDRGQVEAATALGMRPVLTMRRVVLPQAMRVIVPPTGNEFISLLKTSSLASAVQFNELFKQAQNIYSTNHFYLELLLVICVWYLVLTSTLSVGQFYLERHFSVGNGQSLPVPFIQRLWRGIRPGHQHS